MTEYKPKTINIILNMILIVLFVAVVIFLTKKGNYLFSMICVIIIYYVLSLYFFKKRVININIDSALKIIRITYNKFGMLKSNEEYQFHMIKCTYEIETGPRGTKGKELRLYDSKQKLIFKIKPNYEGWAKNDLESIHKELEDII